MSFIDIHGHYAWNIDDGIPSYEDARKALELARENRISAIVATPYVTPGVHTKDDIHDFIQRIDDLRMLATEYNIDILDGCELFLNHDYQKALDQNLFIPIENTQYVLVEFDVRGHLIQLAMPEAYGVANFRRESLPILPPDFQLIPRQVKAEKGYKADPGVLKQLKVIKEVFDQCDKIIVATDAGREGELIFRYIFHYLNCRKPFVRLWISSLTDKAIREGLDNLQPGEYYDNG